MLRVSPLRLSPCSQLAQAQAVGLVGVTGFEPTTPASRMRWLRGAPLFSSGTYVGPQRGNGHDNACWPTVMRAKNGAQTSPRRSGLMSLREATLMVAGGSRWA